MPYLSIAVFAALTLAIALAWHLPMLAVAAYAAASIVCSDIFQFMRSPSRSNKTEPQVGDALQAFMGMLPRLHVSLRNTFD